MTNLQRIAWMISSVVVVGAGALGMSPDHLRNVKIGEAVPSYRLPTVDGEFIDNTDYDGEVVVIVYLSAEQRSSEQAAVDSSEVFDLFEDEPVRMVHVTADVVHKPYFDRLREETGVSVPLGLDASRKLYGDLGLIVFPTTIIGDKEGNLTHVISTRGPEYKRVLEAYIRHTLGEFDQADLESRLRSKVSQVGTSRSLASRHRAAARLLRQKKLIDDARNELLKAMEFDPSDTNIRLDLADIDLLAGENEESLELARGVLAESAEHRRAKELAGIALFKLGEMEEARRVLSESLSLNPNPARAKYYLGRIDELEGHRDEALAMYREAVEHLIEE